VDQSDSPGVEGALQTAHRLSEILALFPLIRDDHLRTLQKCGLVQPTVIKDGDRFVGFADVVVIRQIHGELQRGASFRSVLRSLLASHAGQLAFDFRVDTQPAKVISLTRPAASNSERVLPLGPGRSAGEPHAANDAAAAEQYFALASSLDDGSAETQERAAAAYRRALELDPQLVPALINLANIHYSRDCLIEAMALYERAVALEPDVFEGFFNLGNIHHDLGRYRVAEEYYLHALAVNPRYPEAHLYLAVALEKDGRSEEARPHWRAYHALSPDGEWADLAREFSE
jgi:tetratricopeptide (TPR) repeat protein